MGETLLVELVTEELPPKALKILGEIFADRILNGLVKTNLKLRDPRGVIAFATPRRLAVLVPDVLPKARDRTERIKLMPAKVAFDPHGKPSPALLKRLDKERGAAGVLVANVQRVLEGNVEYAFVELTIPGANLLEGLQAALDDAISKLPIPKVMSYQRPDGTTVKFLRPAHRLVALHGASVVSVSALGLDAGNITNGHRFLGRAELSIANADAWEPTLAAEGKVIASFAARRAKIVESLHRASEHANVIMPDELLDEVTALVEWPAVYAGTFDPAFLDVPQECLILTMQKNQKYFALASDEGSLIHRFLLVSNVDARDPSAIIHGNERVLRARLADAKFFYDQDRKIRLADRVGRLATVVYHNELGPVYERVVRIKGIAEDLAIKLGVDAAYAGRAALLCKADLVTDMVGEFPELQGLMGRYYAQQDGEEGEVADAIEQHYWPRFAGDKLPQSGVAQAVALADKLEALTGFFGIGQAPTGDKDPFGLRRAALGVLRILIEKRLHLSLSGCVEIAVGWHESDIPQKAWAQEIEAQMNTARTADVRVAGLTAVAYITRRMPEKAAAQLFEFLYDRLRGYLRELGYTANEVAAVVDSYPDTIDDLPARLDAVRAFEALPEAQSLAAANKRVRNILKQAPPNDGSGSDKPFEHPAENALFNALNSLGPRIAKYFENQDYKSALVALAELKQPVDQFFDKVMVMVDDPSLRNSRLDLLRNLYGLMNQVADISCLDHSMRADLRANATVKDRLS
jgi:glycyl-tRNA synthetase beta chain